MTLAEKRLSPIAFTAETLTKYLRLNDRLITADKPAPDQIFKYSPVAVVDEYSEYFVISAPPLDVGASQDNLALLRFASTTNTDKGSVGVQTVLNVALTALDPQLFIGQTV